VGSRSSHAAVAGVILIVHPKSDRVVRLLAVAAQAVGHLAVFAAMQQADGRQLEVIEATQEKLYDGHLTFSWNPLRFGSEAFEHYRRLAVVSRLAPGGSQRVPCSRWPDYSWLRSRNDSVFPLDISP
jgi:hypothetical protein